MTLKEYRKLINDPELDKYENLTVVTSIDDEGNGYNEVYYSPAQCKTENLCYYDGEEDEVVVLN